MDTHIGLGYCYYFGGHTVREQLLNHSDLHVIRTEYCERDSLPMLHYLATIQNQSIKTHTMPQIHMQKKKTILPKTLSQIAYTNIAQQLRLNGETQLYIDILSRRARL